MRFRFFNKNNDRFSAALEKESVGAKMNQTYCIFNACRAPRRPGETRDAASIDANEREVFFRYGDQVYNGRMNIGAENVSLSSVPSVLAVLQARANQLPRIGLLRDLSHESHLRPVLDELKAATAFLEQAITDSEKKLHEMSQLGITAWIDEDWARSYFELQAKHTDGFEHVDIIVCKVYIRQVQMNIIYHKCSYYVALVDAEAGGEQPLLDSTFPDVSTRSRGYQIAAYNHSTYRKLSLWQVLDGNVGGPLVRQVRCVGSSIAGSN